MARILSTEEQAALGTSVAAMAPHARSHVRLEIEDVDGYMVDMTHVLHGYNYRTDKDATVIGGTVTLSRWHTDYENSLSPLITDAIDAGRALHLYLTTLLHSEGVPVAEDLRLVWDAEIDRVDAGGEYIELSVRDRIGATLADMEMVDAVWMYAQSGGYEWEDVIAHVLLQAYGQSGGDIIGDPQPIVPTDFDATGITVLEEIGGGVPESRQPRLRIEPRGLLDIVREFANRIGWQLRPRWNETAGAFLLAFYEPPHEKATVDWYIPKSRYLVIPELVRDRTDIRNAVRVRYVLEGGVEATYPADGSVLTDAESVARYGFRFTELVEGEDSPIRSEAAAQALAELFLADMAEPEVDLVVEILMNFAVDLDDRITLEANDDHFATDQTLAVVGYEHDFGPDRERVRLTLRGKPTGGVQKWKRRVTVSRPPGPWIRVTGMESTATSKTFYFERGAAVIYVYEREVAVGAELGEIDWDETDIVDMLSTETEWTTDRPEGNVEKFVFLQPRGVNVEDVGEGVQFVVSGRVIFPELIDPTHDETTTPGTGVYGITVSDPSGIATDLYRRTKSGPDPFTAWGLETATPTHEAAYTEGVTLIEGHHSFVEFDLQYQYDGELRHIYSKSSGMDFGVRANIMGPRYEFRGTRLWVFAGVDSDAPTSGVQWVGRATIGFIAPADPTLAAHQFKMEDEPSRFGGVDTGIDFPNSGTPDAGSIGIVKLRAIGIDGSEGPIVSFNVSMPGFEVVTPSATVDVFTQTKEQGGTACTTDPAQSEVIYDVDCDPTDTVSIEKYIDGGAPIAILTNSTTHADTIIDDHPFYEDGIAITPIREVVYRIVVRTSGGAFITDDYTDLVTFEGAVDC